MNFQPDMAPDTPDIDCVLIGVNSSKSLAGCISSILSSDYPGNRLHLYYVDGGSSDASIEIAKHFREVTVIALNLEYPTPGLGRNNGWKQGKSSFIQFLDSDTVLDPEWLRKAIQAMDDTSVGATMGFLKEMHPEHSIYNWIGSIEWNGPAGISDCFGGNVLIRREALEQTGGFDEKLVGGEDPELSRRIIRKGWKIIRLDALMSHHDLAMTTMRQYLKRAFRSGYGFAAVRRREAREGSPFWHHEFRKIMIKGGGFLCCTMLSAAPVMFSHSAMATVGMLLLLVFGSTLLLSPRLFKIEKFMHENNLNREEAIKYSWHCSLVVLPQLFGVIRFYFGLFFNRPLKNRRNILATGLSTTSK